MFRRRVVGSGALRLTFLGALWGPAFLLSAGNASAQPVSFLGPNNPRVGAAPVSLAVGDFNGDGRRDVAVANVQSNDVSVLLDRGNGTFAPALTTAVGTFPFSLAIGDFNRDLKPDLAVANAGSNTVSILLGNGDGTFQPAASVAVGESPHFVVAADFNRDGRADLAAANSDSHLVSVLLGRGDGSFAAAPALAAGAFPVGLAVADFNRDGALDLAAAATGSDAVTVMLGNGNGTFQPALVTDGVGDPWSLAAGDFDADGTTDLAVGGQSLYILLGNGDGTLRRAASAAAVSGVASVAVGDFNRDGKHDVAAASTNVNSGRITVTFRYVSAYLGNGDGTLQPAKSVLDSAGFGDTSTNPVAVAVGDFNGDTRQDLVVADALSTFVSVRLGFGDGTFQVVPPVVLGAQQATSVLTGDVNRDGNADLVTLTGACGGPGNYVAVRLGNGNGTFRPPKFTAAGFCSTGAAIGDYDRDGVPDLAAPSGGPSITMLLGNGDGSFRRGTDVFPPFPTAAVAAGDINGDGILDLAVSGTQPSSPPIDNAGVLIGNGDGTFRLTALFSDPSNIEAVALADFNGDARLDLALGSSGRVRIGLGNGDGTFQPLAPTPSLGSGLVASIVVGDWNGDGALDLSGVIQFGGTDTWLLLGEGGGTFQPGPPPVAGSAATGALVAGDFDRDGKSDLAVGTARGVSVLVGNGDGSFQPPVGYNCAPTNSLAVADFNRDGRPDLAPSRPPLVSGETATVSVLFNITP